MCKEVSHTASHSFTGIRRVKCAGICFNRLACVFMLSCLSVEYLSTHSRACDNNPHTHTPRFHLQICVLAIIQTNERTNEWLSVYVGIPRMGRFYQNAIKHTQKTDSHSDINSHSICLFPDYLCGCLKSETSIIWYSKSVAYRTKEKTRTLDQITCVYLVILVCATGSQSVHKIYQYVYAALTQRPAFRESLCDYLCDCVCELERLRARLFGLLDNIIYSYSPTHTRVWNCVRAPNTHARCVRVYMKCKYLRDGRRRHRHNTGTDARTPAPHALSAQKARTARARGDWENNKCLS